MGVKKRKYYAGEYTNWYGKRVLVFCIVMALIISFVFISVANAIIEMPRENPYGEDLKELPLVTVAEPKLEPIRQEKAIIVADVIKEEKIVHIATQPVREQDKWVVREITAYNAGDVNQCDSTPCISANGENICEALRMGFKRCAANFVPLGTDLIIEGYGNCKVTDRMNSRYKNRVDIAFPLGDDHAIKWGLKKLNVMVVDK